MGGAGKSLGRESIEEVSATPFSSESRTRVQEAEIGGGERKKTEEGGAWNIIFKHTWSGIS